MKHYLKLLSALFILTISFNSVEAQTKTKIKTKNSKTKVKSEEPAFVERKYGTPTAVTDITDISDSVIAYKSVQNLLDNHVTLTYDDNTFRGNEPVRKGDFIFALNSSLDAIKNMVDSNMPAMQDGMAASNTSMPMNNDSMSNSTDANMSNTSMDVANNVEVKGLSSESMYYPAAQGLLAKGITAPFSGDKDFRASAPMTETEVYTALDSVFGYGKAGLNPYGSFMTRSKFAMVLNNAVSKKMMEEYAVIDQKNAEMEEQRKAEKMKMQEEMKQQEQMKRDSLNSAYKAEQMEIERLALEKEAGKKHKRKSKSK